MYTAPMFWWLFACVVDEAVSENAYIAPANGQTVVGSDVPLLVSLGTAKLPADYPGGIQIDVWNIDTEEAIPGDVFVENGQALFRPRGRFSSGRYAWSVIVDDDLPHGPEYDVPNRVVDASVFEVGGDPVILGATLLERTDQCFIFSAPVDVPLDDIQVLYQGVDVAVTAVRDTGAGWQDPYPLLDGDEGLDVICVGTDPLVFANEPVRVIWGDHDQVVQTTAGGTEEFVKTLRRAQFP